MASTKYAIGTYEINLLKEEDLKATFSILQKTCQWIDTAINYDNDYLLPLVANKQTKIISKISSCHFNDYEFFVDNHLKCLQRDQVDLMLIHSGRGDWHQLACRMVKDQRFKHTGVSNFSAKDMQAYYDATGQWPYANELEINPYYTDLEAIKFCKEHGILIIAYAILGGKYNSWQTVAEYGLGNLIAFAKQYADIIIIRANSATEANHFSEIIDHFDFDHASHIEPFSKLVKTIEPMQYKTPTVYNRMYGWPTYLREYPYNYDTSSQKVKVSTKVDIELPKFEMLGDYKVYLRYKYQSNTYFGDWLSIGDNKYITLYLWDKDNKLTKVVPNAANIEVWQLQF